GEGVVIIDCVTLLVNNITGSYGDRDSEGLIEEKVTAEIRGLIDCIDQTDARFIIVSNEVGLGLVPANKLGRFYRDILGRVNQILARRADEFYLMVCGLPVAIKTPGRN
ncbi:MAG: bifunctional adenosylcobinamide kinase/adenosylcobinamide-phosphate guanylyltransferase, partial [Dehalococcoidales bacterium]|nr:bifunctional adenosylcobinamide kinase/adenosylcobinamide-phosphate guanylyltransferase [Dehalococcoidales bacterium]